VVDNGLTAEEIEQEVLGVCTHLNLPAPEGAAQLFRGLTTWEIKAAIAQSVIQTKAATGKVSIESKNIVDYRRKSLRKSDLLSYVDTKDCSFDNVGGLPRFKEWCTRTKAAWSEEGRAYGLAPPKGVLAVGVWGCGKSISVKAMGQAWGLPVVALEMGKLRGMAQGASESNVYTALKLIEQVSPCVVWIDEAEKSLSGGQSSAMTDGGTTNRMIGIFSTWLQETEAPVTLALTANSLGTLPIEFVNRMDERFFFDLPAVKDRIEILKIHIGKLKRNASDFNLAMLAEKADQLVGREIEQAVKAALRDSFFAGKPNLDENILAAELARKPRISKTMVDEIQSLIQWVGFDPEANDGIRARYAAPPARNKVKAFEGT
jgi:SpoVK/Ycf46/Vps4 family AAA+-type ATPase